MAHWTRYLATGLLALALAAPAALAELHADSESDDTRRGQGMMRGQEMMQGQGMMRGPGMMQGHGMMGQMMSPEMMEKRHQMMQSLRPTLKLDMNGTKFECHASMDECLKALDRIQNMIK